jgi:hypothetical protein
MLRQDSGEYACIAEDAVRYNLGEVKEELQAAMGLNTEAEGSALQVRKEVRWGACFDVVEPHATCEGVGKACPCVCL